MQQEATNQPIHEEKPAQSNIAFAQHSLVVLQKQRDQFLKSLTDTSIQLSIVSNNFEVVAAMNAQLSATITQMEEQAKAAGERIEQLVQLSREQSSLINEVQQARAKLVDQNNALTDEVENLKATISLLNEEKADLEKKIESAKKKKS